MSSKQVIVDSDTKKDVLPTQTKPLDMPPLEEIAIVLNEGLKDNFKTVEVKVEKCPDLTQKPFSLAKPGLCGNTKLVEIGGVPYLLPKVNKDKIYDLKQIVSRIGPVPAFIIGAGAGPFPYAGVNCEGIFNLVINKNGEVVQQTRISKVDPANEAEPIQEILPINETRVALLANLFFSEGKPGRVLHVHAKERTGKKDFIASIRETLQKEYNTSIGLGGVFVLKEGKAKQHVMRDFSSTPINNEEQLNNWLKFYNMSAPLVAVGTLINRDLDLDLRVQHFHSFSDHGEAGHYHIDTTPETVEYEGYFNLAEDIYRIDRPEQTHNFGRD